MTTSNDTPAPAPAELSLAQQELLRETAKIPWSELEHFFANGTTIYVAAELDLITVALAVKDDDAELIKLWMAEGKVGQVSNEQALEWHNKALTLWTVVVKPWILVQTPRL
ncbi:MAG: DUF2288 domain-containing protein [Pseudomonadales bacterium]